MMTFTKIAIALLSVGAVALVAFGTQILKPSVDEKTVPALASPSPRANSLVGALDTAKNVQQLQDTRFDTTDVVSTSDIPTQNAPKDSYVIAGTVVKENTCPPCPKGSEGLCAPCPADTFTITESNNNQVTIRANSSYPVKVGEKYFFTISGDANSGWTLVSAKPQ